MLAACRSHSAMSTKAGTTNDLSAEPSCQGGGYGGRFALERLAHASRAIIRQAPIADQPTIQPAMTAITAQVGMGGIWSA
jgi:hypothetical protein